MTKIAIINAGFKPGLPDIDFAGIVRNDKPKRGRRTLVLPADLEEWIEKLSTIERQRQSNGARRGANR